MNHSEQRQPHVDTPDSLPPVAIGLGCAGLLPFCCLPLLLYLNPDNSPFYAALLASYALAILCFLVGIWWGLALIRRSPPALVISNAIVIVAFIGHALLSNANFFVLCAILYPVTVLIERRAWLFRAQPVYYARLRAVLTVIATASMLLAVRLL